MALEGKFKIYEKTHGKKEIKGCRLYEIYLEIESNIYKISLNKN
jgi:hypothetical protein